MDGVSVKLRIGSLSLEGMAPHERTRVAEALRRELQERLAEPGLAGRIGRSRHVGAVDGGSITVTRGAKPEALAADLAGSISRRLEE